MKMKFEIVENAKRQARMIFLGMAVVDLVEIPDDRVIEGEDSFYVYGVDGQKRYLVTEKVRKFNRKALRRGSSQKIEKSDPRFVGGEDTMIVKIGTPGSVERKAALAEQYAAILACGEKVSPFGWEA